MVVLLADINIAKRQANANFKDKKINMTIAEFEKLTKKLIMSVSSRSVANRILMDEDAFNYICVGIMEGTWRFDDTRGMALFSYQAECAKYSIKKWLAQYKKHKSIESLNHTKTDDDSQIYSQIVSEKDLPADDYMIENETQQAIGEFFSKASLSKSQRKCLTLLFYDDMKQADIARHLKISREAVNQNIKRGIANLREQYQTT